MVLKVWTDLNIEDVKTAIKEEGIPLHNIEISNDKKSLKRANIIFGLPGDKDLAEIQCGHSKVRWIQLPSVDYSHYSELKNTIVTNIRGLMADQVAQTIVGSLLGIYRGIFAASKAQERKDWQRWPIRNNLESLRHKRVLFLGGGAIAQACMKLLKVFDCSFTVYRRQKQKLGTAKLIHTKGGVLRKLKEVDIVINTLPANQETESFMNEPFFNACLPECIICNVGRGATIDEKALVMGLKKKKIKAAVLDVTRIEPLNSKSPLWSVKGLHLTQHTAGGHRDEEKEKSRFFALNLKRYLQKRPLLNNIHL